MSSKFLSEEKTNVYEVYELVLKLMFSREMWEIEKRLTSF